MTFVLPLDDPQATLERAGGKGSSLAKLASAGLPVPGGFHLTTNAYREFVEVNELDGVIEGALETVDPDRPATLEDASTTIRKAFVEGSVPDAIVAAITEAYRILPCRVVAACRCIRSTLDRSERRSSPANSRHISMSPGRSRYSTL